jgi:hypothetical protein
MPQPGDVFYLPVQEGERTDPAKGDRPWVVLADASATADIVTVVYGSTKPTEAFHGAAHVLIDPLAGHHRRTGLSAPTYVYPSRLASYPPDAFGTAAGNVADELPLLRNGLRTALGFGRGVTREPNLPRSNVRGRIVRLTGPAASYTGYELALVITEPGYSRRNRQQTVVPVLPGEDYEPAGHDLFFPDPEWSGAVGRRFGTAILAIPMVVTLFAPDWFGDYTDAVVSPGAMYRVESALADYFGL